MRRFLALVALIAYLLLPLAHAADTTWDTTFGTIGAVYSNGNHTSTAGNYRVMVAVDFPAARFCVFQPGQGKWYSDSGSNATLSSVTCASAPLITGSTVIYPGAYLGTGQAFGIYGSNMQNLIPSGYTTWDSCAGGTLKWDSTNKGAGWSLSSSDTVATATASDLTAQGRGSTGIASNSGCKVVFEIEVIGNQYVNGYYSAIGIANGSWNLSTTYIGFDSNGAQYTSQYTGNNNCYRYNTSSCGSDIWVGPNAQKVTRTSFERLGRATTSVASGSKVYWEVTVNGDYIDFGVVVGSTGPTCTSQPDCGYVGGNINWSGMGYSPSSPGTLQGFIGNAAVITSNLPTFTTNKTVGVALDNRSGGCSTSTGATGAPLMWFRVDGVWYGSASGADPETQTNGLASSDGGSCVNGTLWPAYSQDSNNSLGVATINGGSSAFSYPPPAGFTCLDGSGPGCGGRRGRITIIGANDNYPPVVIEADRCRWAA